MAIPKHSYKNPNEGVGTSRLKPGQKHSREDYEVKREQRKNELVLVGARVPRYIADEIDEIIEETNKTKKLVTKQEYITEILARAIKTDKQELEETGQLSRFSNRALY